MTLIVTRDVWHMVVLQWPLWPELVMTTKCSREAKSTFASFNGPSGRSWS